MKYNLTLCDINLMVNEKMKFTLLFLLHGKGSSHNKKASLTGCMKWHFRMGDFKQASSFTSA